MGQFTKVPQVRIGQTVNVHLETVQDKWGTPSRQDLTTETTKTYDLHTLQVTLLTKLQSDVVKDIVQSNTYEGAIGFLEKRVENKTRNAHADLACLLILLERHNEAIKVCKEGLEVASHKSILYQLIGIAYTMVGLPTQATNAFSNALDVDPDNPEVKDFMKALALIYPQGKTNIRTIAECREYLRRNPGDQSAHRRLADAYLANKNFGEATHAYEMALQIEPTDGLSHLGLGILHMSLNRYGDAIVCLTNANRNDPTNPDTYYYLGLCYLKDGQRAMALKQYEVLNRINENSATKLFDAIYPSA
ncbi:MAG TPA: tetratricopeptide repeat protein [Candidatus Hydrogenedentes bacterium]|nr:tetratricopeptide repeat protein [Candidatus Hydrogenedentota bacterium]